MAKIITFTLYGNQEKKDGNPIPYYRVTSQSKWSDGSKRYAEWKRFVTARYLDAIGVQGPVSREDFGDFHDLLSREPIVFEGKCTVNLKIHWRDKTHGDCDNVFKGIADALFKNDKYVAGSFDYDYSVEKKGSVFVEIIFHDDTGEK